MVSYNALMRQKEFFIKLFRDTYNEAESNRPLTNASATSVQRLFMGVTLRSIITKQRYIVFPILNEQMHDSYLLIIHKNTSHLRKEHSFICRCLT